MSEWVSLEPGRVLERRYEIVGLLGRGGFGATYRAVDRRRLGEHCVVKELLPPPARADRVGPALAVAAERFEREARTLLRLRHPHVPRLHAFFKQDGRYFLVQDLVEGRSLHQRLQDEGPLGEAEVRDVVAQVLDVLVYLHEHRPPVVHRDVKPANVIVDTAGRVHLIDFGAVREALSEPLADGVEGPTTRVGTPGYAPFEQVMGRVVPASDLYALGATAVTLLTGDEPLVWLGRHDDSWVLEGRTGASRAFERFLARMLADLPSRFASAAEARAALAALDAPAHAVQPHGELPQPTPVRPSAVVVANEPRLARMRPPSRWRRVTAAALAGVVVIVVGRSAWRTIAQVGEPLDRHRITVFPLVLSGDFDMARTVGEDVATAIGATLDGAGPLRWIDGWRLLDDEARGDVRHLSSDDARALARARRSAVFVTGRLARRGDSVDVTLDLHDVAGDSLIATARASGAARDPWQTGLRAASRLLPAVIPEGAATLTAGWDARAPVAVARLLSGEAAFRRARPAEALAHFRAAVAADSGFGLAALRGAEAAAWMHRDEEAGTLVRVALRQPLGPRDAHFARGEAAYLAGRADSATAELERALRIDPDMTAAWIALGEVRTHLLPPAGSPDSLAAAAFETAARLDPAAVHLVHLAEREIRSSSATQSAPLVDRLLAAGPDSTVARQLRLAATCAQRGETAVDWSAAVVRDPLAVLSAAKLLAGGGARLPCAHAAYATVLRADTLGQNSEPRRWTALVGLQSTLLAQGRTGTAAALLDSVIAAGFGGATLVLLDALVVPELAARAEAIAAADTVAFGRRYERCRLPLRLWHLGLWAAHRGRGEVAAAVAQRLAVLAAGGARIDSLYARSMAAHAALARGDTVDAMRQLAALLAEPATADELGWDAAVPRGAERLLLARLFLARGEPQRARDVASVFDSPWPSIHLLFLPASLALRADAATALGERAAAERLRARLAALRTDGRLAAR